MRKYKQIIQEQRFEISGYSQAEFNESQIAKLLGFHKSTINRELNRNGSISYYDLEKAQKKAEEWSPDQIHGRCKADNIDMVNHESIYQFV